LYGFLRTAIASVKCHFFRKCAWVGLSASQRTVLQLAAPWRLQSPIHSQWCIRICGEQASGLAIALVYDPRIAQYEDLPVVGVGIRSFDRLQYLGFGGWHFDVMYEIIACRVDVCAMEYETRRFDVQVKDRPSWRERHNAGARRGCAFSVGRHIDWRISIDKGPLASSESLTSFTCSRCCFHSADIVSLHLPTYNNLDASCTRPLARAKMLSPSCTQSGPRMTMASTTIVFCMTSIYICHQLLLFLFLSPFSPDFSSSSSRLFSRT
jgi:hypothetical protein